MVEGREDRIDLPAQRNFTKPAGEIARIMARKEVSPGGINSAIKNGSVLYQPGQKRYEPRTEAAIGESQTYPMGEEALDVPSVFCDAPSLVNRVSDE